MGVIAYEFMMGKVIYINLSFSALIMVEIAKKLEKICFLSGSK